jgi:putative transposase
VALPDCSEVHTQVLQEVVQRVDRAYQAFFRRMKAGATPGSLRFHGRNRSTGLTSPQFGRGVALANGYLVLSKIASVGIRWSRLIEGAPKTVTRCREADGWYVCFSCAGVRGLALPPAGQERGIDLGIEAFAAPSDGTRIFQPGWYRRAERRLKTAQRRESRRKQGSARRRKAVQLLAKAHLTVKRQRADFHHKTALTLVRANDTIHHEDLQVANMVKNHSLA